MAKIRPSNRETIHKAGGDDTRTKQGKDKNIKCGRKDSINNGDGWRSKSNTLPALQRRRPKGKRISLGKCFILELSVEENASMLQHKVNARLKTLLKTQHQFGFDAIDDCQRFPSSGTRYSTLSPGLRIASSCLYSRTIPPLSCKDPEVPG